MIKAVFFDVDGTLLSFKTHQIPESTLEAISLLQKKNIRVLLATGRSFHQLQKPEFKNFDGYVTFNGNVCLNHNQEIFFKNSIPKSDLEALIAYQENVRPFPCAFMSIQENTLNYVDDDVVSVFNMLSLPIQKTKDMREAIKNDVIQLNVFLNPQEEKDVMEKALVSCETSRWTDLFADVNVKNTNKSTGVDQFAKLFNIDVAETLSFGDGGNDLAMLKHTGIGVAMGDASANVKAAADYVTDGVDDNGIWNALKHFEII